jgi:hypothetical protein
LKTFTDLISTQTIDVLQILLQELQLCGMLMAELFSGAGITTPLLQELQICRWSDEDKVAVGALLTVKEIRCGHDGSWGVRRQLLGLYGNGNY